MAKKKVYYNEEVKRSGLNIIIIISYDRYVIFSDNAKIDIA